MAYQLIALDMDGTLLDSKKRVLPSSLDAIRRASDAGKAVAISSGRCPAMVALYKDDLPGVRYAICCAGATIYDLEQDKTMFEQCLDPAFVDRALEVAEGLGFFLLEVTSGANVYMQPDEVEHVEEVGVGAHALARELRGNLSKLNFHFASVEARDRCRELLEGDDVVITNAERSTMEFTARGIDKGQGVARLAQILGIDNDQTIAVGDAENDLSMLRSAGLGVAMGNALPEAVAAADVQVADNDHDGVAEAIRRYLLA